VVAPAGERRRARRPGQAVQPPADVLDDVAGRTVRTEAGTDRPGAIDEQLDGGQRCQAADRHQDFPGDAERLAAGSDQPQTGHRSGQGVGQRGRLADDVLAVVEDDDQRASGQVAHDQVRSRSHRLSASDGSGARPERGGRGRRHPAGPGHGGQLDQPGAVRVVFAQGGGRLHRQAGLARAARAGQRDEPAGADRRTQLSQLGVAADEAAQPGAQVPG